MFTQMLRVQELDAITEPVFVKGKQQCSFVAKVVSVTTSCAISTKPVRDNHSGEAAEKDLVKLFYKDRLQFVHSSIAVVCTLKRLNVCAHFLLL